MKNFLNFFFSGFVVFPFFCFGPSMNFVFFFGLSNFLTQHQGTTHNHHLAHHTSPRQSLFDTYEPKVKRLTYNDDLHI